MIHVFREKDFFYLFLVPLSWSVSHAPIRVVIIIIMDHSYNNNNKWRSDAIFSDPRVWINRGSSVDQRGSTWINRLQHAPSASWLMRHAVLTHGSCVMRPDSWLMRHALSPFSVLTHGSCVMRPASMRPASMRPASMRPAHGSCVRRHALMRHGSCVRRPCVHASGVRRHASCVRRPASMRPRVHASTRPASTRPASGVRRPRVRRPASGIQPPGMAPGVLVIGLIL